MGNNGFPLLYDNYIDFGKMKHEFWMAQPLGDNTKKVGCIYWRQRKIIILHWNVQIFPLYM